MRFPLELPSPDVGDIKRADLTVYGLDHSGPTYRVRVFFDQPDATVDTPLQSPNYVGSFTVFGHGGCFGDEGHCDVRGPVTPFDRRLPHQLVPATRVLICTDAVKQRVADRHETVTVTLVPVVRESPFADPSSDVLQVGQICLHTYE
jgi:tyrosinase